MPPGGSLLETENTMLRNSNRIIKILLFLSALLLSAGAQQQTITGKVVGVSDGDTLTVLDASNQQHKIGLLGIDAPESNQVFGSRAKQSLSDLVFGKTVTVTSEAKDMYGRALGDVTLDGRNINLEQVRRGFAWFYRFYAKELRTEDVKAYDQAEAQAKKEKRGLWADASPMPPWEFRQGGKAAKAAVSKPPAMVVVGPIIGNRSSKIYHLPNCPDFTKVGERNRAPFKTEAEAQAAGYRKAKNCPQ
jgi:endonuclease YncB( thermonuclease family)